MEMYVYISTPEIVMSYIELKKLWSYTNIELWTVKSVHEIFLKIRLNERIMHIETFLGDIKVSLILNLI